jgi:hypothetical protein
MKILRITLVLCLVGAAAVVVEGFATLKPSRTAIATATKGQQTARADKPEPEQQLDYDYDFSANFTGMERRIDWPAAGQPVPAHAEISLLKSGVLSRRGEFAYLTGTRADEVASKCEELGMTQAQGFIIRKQFLVTNVVQRTSRLLAVGSESFDNIHRKFNRQERTIQKLSWEVDLPPVSIIRAIVRSRVDEAYPDWKFADCKRLVKNIISGKAKEEEINRFLLTEWEMEQLQMAKESDVISYQEQPSEIRSNVWEEALYTYLEEQDIKYTTEDDMRQAGSRITPDCLLLDDCVINGKNVRWIDAKNSYASGLRENWHFAKKLKQQIAKYENEYGASGAVIFKHGFSSKLAKENPYTLFLDAGPLI